MPLWLVNMLLTWAAEREQVLKTLVAGGSVLANQAIHPFEVGKLVPAISWG